MSSSSHRSDHSDADGDPAILDSSAQKVWTRCGSGQMVWRSWGRGAPLLLLHGAFGSWTHWIRNINRLSSSYRVVAPDLPGLGDSDLPSEPYDAEAVVAILAAGVDAVVGKDQAYDLAGFSFGGVIASALAATHHRRVRSLTLVSTGGLGTARNSIPSANWRSASSADDERQAHRDNLAAMMLSSGAAIDDLAVSLQQENARRSRLRTQPMSKSGLLQQSLPRATCAIAAIYGKGDAMLGDHLEEVEARLRHLTPLRAFAIVPEAGHWLQYERPEAFEATLVASMSAG